MILQLLIVTVAGWINRHQQLVIAYLKEENHVLKSKVPGGRVRLTVTERRRPATLAYPLSRQERKDTATIATPDTLMRWYRRLIADKFDGSNERKTPGRPRVNEEIEQLVIRMAKENPAWGYRRIQGALANLGHHIDKITVRNILRRHHIDPAPKRSERGMRWSQFIKAHWEVLAATNFFTVEVATWHGLVTYYVLVVMEVSTRRVEIVGITPHPNSAFMQQCARQLTDRCDGFLLGKRYLIHDWDRKFTEAFDQYLKDHGVEPVVLPPRSPNLNSHCERFIGSIKSEVLNRMIFVSEASLRRAIRSYLSHYHGERNHQGLDNKLIAPPPDVGRTTGTLKRRKHLGGMLSYYYRQAA